MSVLTAPASAERDLAQPRRLTLPRAAAGVLPWAAALALLAWALSVNGTTGADLMRYAAYVAFGLALPGTLLLRATLRHRRPLTEDLVLGSIVGLAVQLALFVPATAMGIGSWLRWWPVVVVVLFGAVPALRRRLRSHGGDRAPLPVLWHWGTATAAVDGSLGILRSVAGYPLPPGEGPYYIDVLWHLGIVHSVQRSIPPETPQVDGTTLRYHWFSHADMAAAHLVSGVPDAVLLMRVWPVAMTVLLVLAAALLARELSGIWWAGPVAAWVLSSFRGLEILPVNLVTGAASALSPSQSYVAPVALGSVVLIVRALRGERLRWGWLLVVLITAAAGGAKPTALPEIACGAVLVLVAGAVFFRKREALMPAAWTLAICAVLFSVTSRFLTGSDSDTSIRFFDFVEWQPLYRDLTDGGGVAVVGPMLPEGVADLSVRSLQILGLLLMAVLVPQLPLLASSLAFVKRRVRHDPAAWFLAGAIASAYGVYFMLSHPAYSQLYFVRLALAFVAPVLAWVVAATVERLTVPPVGRALVLVVGTALGVGVQWLARRQTPAVAAADRGDLDAWRHAFLLPVVVALACLAVVGVLVVIGRRVGWVPRHMGIALLTSAAVIGVPLVKAFDPAVARWSAALHGDQAPRAGGIPTPAGGGAAMGWLNRNTPKDAVVATNRHCASGRQRPGCYSANYVVSGLGGRQVVLEAWRYVSVSGGPKGPNPYPERLAANDALFTDPSAAAFERMKRDFNVTWLVADSTSTPVSPRITEFATPRFHAGTVTIYEVK